ncbi:hypothetical protein TNCV_2160251 [Trichonephila clavipes]|nr:hypothetical protein TNCV_2160251 [Trichonephila clavipes]
MAAVDIFCIRKIYRLGPGSNPQPESYKVSNKPITPLNQQSSHMLPRFDTFTNIHAFTMIRVNVSLKEAKEKAGKLIYNRVPSGRNSVNARFAFVCHINELLGLEWQQVEKYESKHMVVNSAPTTREKSVLP